ncbi:hypothetical protein [Achromobacter sp. Bel]|uniref:hypothetical protein n=1 Tax=Achromobacter sp. Bel TaxID=2727415 RepID=UPI00145FCD17|nr:hypothetical protein [Achromobacter sp. Bel]NMK47575.1 hypothetical protein [Achromobacter sp. Bel]
MNINSASVGGIASMNLASMDIETALMMVQSERTKLLDAQLQTQIQEVQNRNALMGELNTLLSSLNALLGQFPSDAKGTDKLESSDRNQALATDAAKQAFKLGQDPSPISAIAIKDAAGNVTGATVTGLPTRSEVDAAITKVKGQVDAAGNSQQMDMLRLQSMSNKRNEAFDVMTNFVKKMQDSRASIIGNMR